MSLRSTLSSSMVNECAAAGSGHPCSSSSTKCRHVLEPERLQPEHGVRSDERRVGNFASQRPGRRNTWNWTVTDSLNVLKGAHSMTFGGDFTRHQLAGRLEHRAERHARLQHVRSAGRVQRGQLPGSSTADRNNARALYATLTGRVSSIQVRRG